MEEWRYINSQSDIDEFVKETMGMHDSVMVGLDYMAGTWSDDITTYFSGPNSKNLRVIFASHGLKVKLRWFSKQSADLILPVGRKVILTRFLNALSNWKS